MLGLSIIRKTWPQNQRCYIPRTLKNPAVVFDRSKNLCAPPQEAKLPDPTHPSFFLPHSLANIVHTHASIRSGLPSSFSNTYFSYYLLYCYGSGRLYALCNLKELKTNETFDTMKPVLYFDLLLEIEGNWKHMTNKMTHAMNFLFHILNSPFICGNIPSASGMKLSYHNNIARALPILNLPWLTSNTMALEHGYVATR